MFTIRAINVVRRQQSISPGKEFALLVAGEVEVTGAVEEEGVKLLWSSEYVSILS